MKKIIIGVSGALFSLAIGLGAVSLHNHKSTPSLLLANAEAWTNNENNDSEKSSYKMDRVSRSVTIAAEQHLGFCINKAMPVIDCGCNIKIEIQEISCCVSTLLWWMKCDFKYPNENC